MKKHLILIICMFFLKNIYAQDYYYIIAKSGLNVRENTSLNSQKVAKIPFGVVVKKIENTNKELIITDNGEKIKGNWVKIEYNNYGYLVNEEEEQFSREGFVFDAFLKPLKDEKISIPVQKTTKSVFLKTKKAHTIVSKKLVRITDLDHIKKLLKGRVKWSTWAKDYDGSLYKRDDVPIEIITENNQKIKFAGIGNSDMYFDSDNGGYYPEEDVLVLIGGHSSDQCYSIKTGETTLTIGNPEYIISSPKKTYRLNGYFPGQECKEYFFQKKVNGNYEYFQSFYLWSDYGICYFKEFYWINETQFVFKTSYDGVVTNKSEEYYKGEIKINEK